MNTSNKITKSTGIFVTANTVLFLIFVVGTASAVSKKNLKRTNDNGPVTISATYLNPVEKTDNVSINFEVKLDTHSVDLDQYNLQDLSFIRFDNGTEQKSSGLSTKGSGHHIVYIVSFSAQVPEGTKNITLLIRNVGGVAERLFEWQLPIK
jgi:hypothetical protein